jgi:hypothetical protein
MRRSLGLVVVAAGVLACQSDQPVTSQAVRPSADISDGSNASNCTTPVGTCVPSNPHFYFLGPIDPQATYSGTFNPNLLPTVKICALATDGSQMCDATQPIINPGTVAVDAPDQQYQVNWQSDATPLVLGVTYRLQVFAGSRELGFVDVVPVSNGSAMRDLAAGDTIGLVNGRTLPIKFRLEVGVLCGSDADCGEATIGPAGGTVITNTQLAGAFFPQGALSGNETIVIQPSPQLPCVPVNLPQRPGCYTFTADPGPATFQAAVTVGICAEADGLLPAQLRALLLYKSDPAGGGASGEIVTPLQNTPAAFLPCNGLVLKPRSVWGHVAKFLLPEPLYATHMGVGGSTMTFSRIGWALPPIMTMVPGTSGLAALVGSALPVAPAVILLNPSDLTPVAGLPVSFTVGPQSGTVAGQTSTVVRSGASGVAAVPWTPGQVGLNTLSVGELGDSALVFTATGLGVPTLFGF